MLRYRREAGRDDLVLRGRLPAMRLLLLAAIRIYWWLYPKERRRSCVFRESCSHYVYRITQNGGLFAGVRAFRARVRACRPGYTVTVSGDSVEVRCADGSVLHDNEIADSILRVAGAWPGTPFGGKDSLLSLRQTGLEAAISEQTLTLTQTTHP